MLTHVLTFLHLIKTSRSSFVIDYMGEEKRQTVVNSWYQHALHRQEICH